MLEKMNQTVRSIPDGCSAVVDVKLPNNSVVAALKHLNKITTDFVSLINDEDGQSLFEEYAKLNEIDDYLLFWFAIEGYRKRFTELDIKRKQNEVSYMAKAIYNNFIKNNSKGRVYQWFSKKAREELYTKIVKNKLDPDIFQDVKTEFKIKIQEEIFPRFLKSDLFQKYSDNLKGSYDPKSINKSNQIKNPYHVTSSYTNFHPTSTQESEYQYDLKESKNLINSNPKIKSNSTKDRQLKQKTTKIIPQASVPQSINRSIYDKIYCDRTLKLLYSTGARSQLPQRPEDDIERVKSFIAKLEMIYQKNLEECNQRILKVVEFFEQQQDDKQNQSLRRLMKKDPIKTEDSQSILDQHCSRVFNSNFHTKGLNTPNGQNSPKKTFKQNFYSENQQLLPFKLTKQNKIISSPYHNYSTHSTPSVKLQSSMNQSLIGATTNIMYKYPDDMPYSIKLDQTAITLKQFKKEIIKRPIDHSKQKFRYFFKRRDEIENMHIMEELTDDNDYLPFCDGRIFARIEIVPI